MIPMIFTGQTQWSLCLQSPESRPHPWAVDRKADDQDLPRIRNAHHSESTRRSGFPRYYRARQTLPMKTRQQYARHCYDRYLFMNLAYHNETTTASTTKKQKTINEMMNLFCVQWKETKREN